MAQPQHLAQSNLGLYRKLIYSHTLSHIDIKYDGKVTYLYYYLLSTTTYS